MGSELKPTSERLLNGARKLGALWRSGRRCQRGWSLGAADLMAAISPGAFPGCPCEPKTDFCQGRWLWITLAVSNSQELAEGDHGLAFSMTSQQWEATGLTLVVESEKAGLLRIGGPKGMISASHLAKLADDPQSAVSIFSLTRSFPKAKVEGVVEQSPERVA